MGIITHFDMRGLDIPALTTFPDDNEIDAAAKEAADEAESLLALLGISPKQLQHNPTIVLPPINSLQVGKASIKTTKIVRMKMRMG